MRLSNYTNKEKQVENRKRCDICSKLTRKTAERQESLVAHALSFAYSSVSQNIIYLSFQVQNQKAQNFQ